jgi:3-oxoadipate enol-lactonase
VTAVDLHAVIDGPSDAPPLVLGPSLGTTAAMWEPQVPTLAEHFRVIRYDARGHGASPVPPGPYTIDDFADDLLELLDRLGIDAAHIAGISLGGMTAMAFAAAHPARVNRLVLACTSAHLAAPEAWADRAAKVRADGTSAIADAVVARWTTPAYAAAHPEVMARLRQLLVDSPDDGYVAACGAIERMDLRDRLPAIAAATVVIAGAQDLAIPPVHAERIVAGLPKARLAILDPGAHLANIEQPEAFANLLIEHLRDGNSP